MIYYYSTFPTLVFNLYCQPWANGIHPAPRIVGNDQDDDKGKDGDNNGDIYETRTASYDDDGCSMIGPYENKYDCKGMFVNWSVKIVVINIVYTNLT